jgi:hypothetical protein
LDDLAWRETNFDILGDFVVLPDFDSDWHFLISCSYWRLYRELCTII